MKNAVNSFATLTFVGYHAENNRAAANARLVKSYDDKEFGAGNGPARMSEAMKQSISETRDRLFFKEDVVSWIRASAAPASEVERLLAQEEEEAGCAVGGGGGTPWVAVPWWIVLAWTRRRAWGTEC